MMLSILLNKNTDEKVWLCDETWDCNLMETLDVVKEYILAAWF